MNEIWEFDENNIGGLQLMPENKKELLEEIHKILKISTKIVDNIIEDKYRPYHHKYIEQKIFAFFN